MSRAYYNEHDKGAAEWLRELIKAGEIAAGDVDERDIRDVRPDELSGYTQCHFFAGIGGWSAALREIGWPDDRAVWTGSCPCQPFSAAGKGAGFDDERHLWPAFFHLIRISRPSVVFGEQVASPDGLEWLDLVQADLEGEAYTFTATDICSAGFGASDIRQRLYWVGDTGCAGGTRRIADRPERYRPENGSRELNSFGIGSPSLRVGDTNKQRLQGRRELLGASESEFIARETDSLGGMANGNRERLDGQQVRIQPRESRLSSIEVAGSGGVGAERFTGPTNGFWRDADWLRCRDGKWRPVEPGTFPLATGIPGRVGLLRGYGNALNKEVAKGFIQAYCEARGLMLSSPAVPVTNLTTEASTARKD